MPDDLDDDGMCDNKIQMMMEMVSETMSTYSQITPMSGWTQILMA